MKFTITRLALLALLSISATACEDEDDGVIIEDSFAQVRVVNAADIANVDVFMAGAATPFVQNLDFRGVTTACALVPPGPRSLVFRVGGTDLATATATFEAGASYTALLVASGTTRRALVVADTAIASTGNNALRFINATATAGDVYVTPPGGAVGASFLAFGNASPLALSNLNPDFMHRSTEHTQVRFFDTGTITTPRADLTLSGLPTSRLGTVVFTDAGTPAGATAFLVTPCS